MNRTLVKSELMYRLLKLLIILLAIIFSGCKANSHVTDSVLLRIAIIGDAEPKPLAEFPNMAAAVDQINSIAKELPIDFVIGVGDIAHRGTEAQYEGATEVLHKLNPPFYPIMGNEEHESTVERYLHYAQKWNNNIESTRYVLDYDELAFVFASPDYGSEFDDSGALWIYEQLQRLAPKPVVLVVHVSQKGVFSEKPERGVGNEVFNEQVISQPNLAVVVSGDLHMDMDRVNHSKEINNVHYLHIPGIERTKVPDTTNHTPMFRLMTIEKDGDVFIDTYEVGETTPSDKHAYSFSINSAAF